LVNEILLDGTVLHLKSLSLPSSSKPSTKPEKKPEEKLAAADTGNGAAEKGTASADVEGTDFTVCSELCAYDCWVSDTWILGFGGRQNALG
jgi:hypothetical protein